MTFCIIMFIWFFYCKHYIHIAKKDRTRFSCFIHIHWNICLLFLFYIKNNKSIGSKIDKSKVYCLFSSVRNGKYESINWAPVWIIDFMCVCNIWWWDLNMLLGCTSFLHTTQTWSEPHSSTATRTTAFDCLLWTFAQFRVESWTSSWNPWKTEVWPNKFVASIFAA